MFLFLSQCSSQITYHRELSSLPWLLRAVIVSRTSFLDNTHRFEEYCSGVLCSMSQLGVFWYFFLQLDWVFVFREEGHTGTAHPHPISPCVHTFLTAWPVPGRG